MISPLFDEFFNGKNLSLYMKQRCVKCVLAVLWVAIICNLLASCSKLNEYSGSGKPEVDSASGAGTDIIYIQTNNSNQNQNGILAYQVTTDGGTELLPGSPFLTGGTGIPSSPNVGSFSSDHEVRLSNDKRFLLTVNSGDNSISVFKINSDGSLSLVPGSPFSSNGETPVSIDQWQQYIIVLNKSNHPIHPSSSPPNYAVFTLEGNGSLTPVSKYDVREGISPGQVHVSRIGGYVYGSNTWGYNYTPPAVRMNLFTIGKDGVLTTGADAPPIDANNPGALGMCQSYKQNVLFVAFPFSERFSMYDINTTTGALTHTGDATARPGCSRFCSNYNNNRLFTANTMENSVSMFDITDAHSPRKTGDLPLKQGGPAYPGYFGTYASSQCVSLAASNNDKFLYVVSQHTNPDTATANYNYLHLLQFTDGGLQEEDDPVQLPVAASYRPRGIAVISLNDLPD
jgi:6-phosphogluconolactonase (cycloisomerase 2 family)